MNKVYTVYRIVKTQLGSYAHPVQVFDDQKVAEDALARAGQTLASMAKGTIMIRTPEGPRAAMSVEQLMHEFGVVGWSYSIAEQTVHGAVIFNPNGIAIQ